MSFILTKMLSSFRVKSLSKSGNSKKDAPLAPPLRESSPPLPPVVPSSASDVMNDITERSNFGWPKKQYVKEQPASTFVDRLPKVKESAEFSSSNAGYFMEQRSKGNMAPNVAEVPDPMYAQGRQQVRRAKDPALERNMRNSMSYPIGRIAEPDEEEEPLNDLLQVVLVPLLDFSFIRWLSRTDFGELLQEEEDLVSAHRKQVEETLDILREVSTL
jgi:kinesin family member 2/24